MSERSSDRDYELVVPVRLPEGMTPEAFLRNTVVEWSPRHVSVTPVRLAFGRSLDELPAFTGGKQMRAASGV